MARTPGTPGLPVQRAIEQLAMASVAGPLPHGPTVADDLVHSEKLAFRRKSGRERTAETDPAYSDVAHQSNDAKNRPAQRLHPNI